MEVMKIPIVKRKRERTKFSGNINNCSKCKRACILRVCIECVITKEIKDPKLYEIYMDCKNNFDKWENENNTKFSRVNKVKEI